MIIKEAVYKIDDILKYFDVDYIWYGDRIICPCPIHGGDNPNGFTFYMNDDNPMWCCFTHSCHENKQYQGIVGFVLAMLHKKNPQLKLKDAVIWLDNFIRTSPTNNEKKEKFKLFIQSNKIDKSKNTFPTLSRNEFRQKVKIPAEYYLNRGYSEEILDKYDVGTCTDYKKIMGNRVVVPIYDEKYKYTVGCTARSIFEQCSKCKQYHNIKYRCPQQSPKWKHDYRFNKSQFLYNWWFCHPISKITRKIFVVEGPGDVWKMSQANIYNSVAIMGVSLSDSQQILFERSGATDIILCMDNDKAGLQGKNSIRKKLSNFFRIHDVELDKKDIGEMDTDSIQMLLKKYI